MAKQDINIGGFVNDPAADVVREAFRKAKENFTELYARSVGDMNKSVYDADNTGVVDSAEKVDGIDALAGTKYYGTNNGVPGFFDLVIEATNIVFYTDAQPKPAEGTQNVVYIDKTNKKIEVWDGTAYSVVAGGTVTAQAITTALTFTPANDAEVVKTVTGAGVDNTDPQNPVINIPESGVSDVQDSNGNSLVVEGVAVIPAGSGFDDTAIQNTLSNHDSRITALEGAATPQEPISVVWNTGDPLTFSLPKAPSAVDINGSLLSKWLEDGVTPDEYSISGTTVTLNGITPNDGSNIQFHFGGGGASDINNNPYLGKTKTNFPLSFGGYINSSGNFIPHSIHETTDFIEITDTTATDFYATYLYGISSLGSPINFYDDAIGWMSAESMVYTGNGTFVDRQITIPTGAKYLRVTSHNSFADREAYVIQENLLIEFQKTKLTPNRFNSADVVNCGDSITWYDGKMLANAHSGGTGGGVFCLGYIRVLSDALGFNSYDNQGASGKSISGNDANSNYAAIAAYDFANKDLVTIAHGTNDFKLNRAIGTIGSITDTTFDTNTFYGAYRTVLNSIIASNVDTEIFLLTPIQRNNSGYTIAYTNTAGHKLVDYVNAIKALGEMYSLKVIDLYSASGINFNNVFSFTIDGLHPNNAGHLRMGNSVIREII